MGYTELAGKFTSHSWTNQLAWQSAATVNIVRNHFIHKALHPHVHVHVSNNSQQHTKIVFAKTTHFAESYALKIMVWV